MGNKHIKKDSKGVPSSVITIVRTTTLRCVEIKKYRKVLATTGSEIKFNRSLTPPGAKSLGTTLRVVLA